MEHTILVRCIRAKVVQKRMIFCLYTITSNNFLLAKWPRNKIITKENIISISASTIITTTCPTIVRKTNKIKDIQPLKQ